MKVSEIVDRVLVGVFIVVAAICVLAADPNRNTSYQIKYSSTCNSAQCYYTVNVKNYTLSEGCVSFKHPDGNKITVCGSFVITEFKQK